MKLLSSLVIREDAAGGVSAGGIASVPMPLMRTLTRKVLKTRPKSKYIRFAVESGDQSSHIASSLMELENLVVSGLSSTGREDVLTIVRKISDSQKKLAALLEDASIPSDQFNIGSVMSKLKSLEVRDRTDIRDTITFGLEDENGKIVRVVVKKDQAADFEHALQSLSLENDDDIQSQEDIAEVLFKLKDDFNIVDVTWPDVEEDEEEPAVVSPDQDNGDEIPLDDLPADDAVSAVDGDADVKSLLGSVIDMMKADADARKAEAAARAAEAKAQEVDIGRQQAEARVKQEEQILDMEIYNKSKKEEDKQAKRLAQLAQWKRNVADDMHLSMDSEYDDVTDDLDVVANAADDIPRTTSKEDEEYGGGDGGSSASVAVDAPIVQATAPVPSSVVVPAPVLPNSFTVLANTKPKPTPKLPTKILRLSDFLKIGK